MMATSAHATHVVPYQYHARLQQYLPFPPTLSTLALALVTCGKSFQSEISSAFSFYARELNLVSKCRQMNDFYCEIIKSWEKYGGEKQIF